MNTPLLAVACALLATGLSAQRTLYVAPAGSGDGATWATAAQLHGALARARAGDQLWLAAGTYFTSATDDRREHFAVPAGVAVLGGFAGKENAAAKRDPAKHRTVLSGAIGTGARTDNAYTVLALHGDHSATTLDGLIVEGAYANGAGAPAAPARAGGGLHIAVGAPKTVSSPTIVNCEFAGNFARDGAAVYIDGRGGEARPSFVGCAFRQNEADLDGGAVYNDARRHGLVAPSFTGCTFDGNVANYGGAVFDQATKGTCTPKYSECAFAGNHAYVRGAALYSIDHQGSAESLLVGCTFVDGDDAHGAAADGGGRSTTAARE